jgi:endonuclease III
VSPKKIDLLFKALTQSIPDPVSELNYQSIYQLLVAVILSAQATDVSVNKVTPKLFQEAPTPEEMVVLGIDKIRSHIKSIGLYNAKAQNIFNCSKMLIEEYDSKVPDVREHLERLPGVGRKTAGVVLNIAYKQATIPVDTHVFRVSNRTGLVKAKTPDKTEMQLMKVVPSWAGNTAHHLLILHGRHICKAKKPLCSQCCICEYCDFPEKRLD